MNSLINSRYKFFLNRNATSYELFIYGEAAKSGFPISEIDNIIKNSSEFKYLNFIKKNNENYDFKNLKVALCLSGHVRSFNVTKLNLYNNIISKFNTDVFFHTWEDSGAQIKSPDKIAINYSADNNSIGIKNAINFLKPKSYLIENNELAQRSFIIPDDYFIFGAPVNNMGVVNSTARPKNIISQFYSIYKSFELMDSYKSNNDINYDLVIKSRFDFKFDSNIPSNELDRLDNKNIFILDKDHSSANFSKCSMCPDYTEHVHDNFINDLVLFGSYTVMTKYMNLYLSYNKIYDKMINLSDSKLKNYYIFGEEKFVGDIGLAKDFLPCFFPENILRYHLSYLKLNSTKINGYVVR